MVKGKGKRKWIFTDAWSVFVGAGRGLPLPTMRSPNFLLLSPGKAGGGPGPGLGVLGVPGATPLWSAEAAVMSHDVTRYLWPHAS